MTGDNILVSTILADIPLADVIYQPDSDRYIVVWQQGGDVYSRGVLPTGVVAGGAAAIASTSQLETNPRLTADLIIWQRQNSGSGFDLYARPLDSNGLPAGELFVIQEAPGNQQNPALAAGSNQRYQLTWQDDATGPWDLYTAVLDRRYQVTHIEYDYDPLYRLLKAQYSGDVAAGYTYIYDAVGNMTAYEETVNGQTSSVNRTFNAANQLVSATDAELGTSTFTYDNNGNLERINLPGFAEEKLLYAYNQRNLLTLVSRQFGYTAPQEEAAFIYDGDGNRLQQIDHTGSQPVTTTYTNDIIGLSQVLVSSNGTTTTYNLFGLDLISQDDGTERRFMLADGLGSVRVEMVGSTVETTTTYEPYGKLLAQTGSSGTVYGFTGEEYDALTGLVYLRTRYYNPYLYQFQSRDPFPGYTAQPQTLHGRSYVLNNPVNFTDPSGQVCIFGYGNCDEEHDLLTLPWRILPGNFCLPGNLGCWGGSDYADYLEDYYKSRPQPYSPNGISNVLGYSDLGLDSLEFATEISELAGKAPTPKVPGYIGPVIAGWSQMEANKARNEHFLVKGMRIGEAVVEDAVIGFVTIGAGRVCLGAGSFTGSPVVGVALATTCGAGAYFVGTTLAEKYSITDYIISQYGDCYVQQHELP